MSKTITISQNDFHELGIKLMARIADKDGDERMKDMVAQITAVTLGSIEAELFKGGEK